jgi:uncharacterized SAM-binding protein YcdF (DUF218 family)
MHQLAAAILRCGLMYLRSKASLKASLPLRSLAMGAAPFLLMGWLPLPEACLRMLEEQYGLPAWPLTPYVGIVVLGGALHTGGVWQTRHQVALGEAAERMTVPVALLHQYPHLRLVHSGWEGDLSPGQDPSQQLAAAAFFSSMGLAETRIAYEVKSTTTYENAVLTAALPGVDIKKPWLLLTSAAHMPRALATFKHLGWNVTPYPVDYQTGTETRLLTYSLAKGIAEWQIVGHEWLGWMKYTAWRRV